MSSNPTFLGLNMATKSGLTKKGEDKKSHNQFKLFLSITNEFKSNIFGAKYGHYIKRGLTQKRKGPNIGAGLAWPIPSTQRECGLGGEHGDEEETHTAHRSSLSVKNGDMEAPQDSSNDSCSVAPE